MSAWWFVSEPTLFAVCCLSCNQGGPHKRGGQHDSPDTLGNAGEWEQTGTPQWRHPPCSSFLVYCTAHDWLLSVGIWSCCHRA